MARQAIKPELTTRELYDYINIYADRRRLSPIFIVLYDSGELVINYIEQPDIFDYAKQDRMDYMKGILHRVMDNYTLPPFESNFIDRSQL